MPVHISHPTCCPPTLMPTPSAHPLHAPTATLSMPLPPARRPLHPTATALSVLPPPPSPSCRHRPLHPAAAAGRACVRTELRLHSQLCYVSWRPSRAAEGQGRRQRGRIWGVRRATRTPPRRVHCAIACHHAAATLYMPPPPSTRCCRPLHAATALYTPPPPSTCCRRPLHATPLPLCAIAGLTTGRCLYVRCRPCLWPSCMRHAQPGPLGAHIAIAHVSPTSTPLTRHPSVPPMSRPRPWPHPWPCPVSQPPSRACLPPRPHLQPCPVSRPPLHAPSPPGLHPQCTFN